MKKSILFWVAITLASLVSQAQTTSVDFTLTDCNGNSRSLYPIIDSGNVVILVYEHQCSSCLVGAKNLKTAINTYYAALTNIRVMYLDNGGYNCTSVKNWISNNSLISGSAFAYSNTQSSPYGSGMPVIVVTGSIAHKVYVIANSVNLPSVTTLKTAIQNALADISNGINTDDGMANNINIYPNPAETDKIWIKLGESDGKITGYKVINTTGQIILPETEIKNAAKQEEISIAGLENGIYFICLNSSKGIIAKKLIISR